MLFRSIAFHKYTYVGVAVLTILVFIALLRAESFDVARASLLSQTDVIEISDASRKQLFYGTLNSMPHTYIFTLKEATRFEARIAVPDDEMSAHTISAILVKEPAGKGRVTEVARLRAGEATWEEIDGGLAGGSLRAGPVFTEDLPSGAYRFEVHTPDNVESYMLTLGTREERTLDYGTFIQELASLRQFLGTSWITLIASPHVYAPLYFVLLMLYAGYLWHARRIVV